MSGNRIHFEINGGPVRKKSGIEHLQIGRLEGAK